MKLISTSALLLALLLVPPITLVPERDTLSHFRMADEYELLGRTHIEQFYLVRH